MNLRDPPSPSDASRMFPKAGYVLLPAVQALAVGVFFLSMKAHLRTARRPLRIALLATLAYGVACEPGAKALYLLAKSRRHPSLWTLLDPSTYLEPGFWGWLLVFLPLAVVFPLVVRVDRSTWFRAVALTLPLVIALQKISCFIAGCCSGSATSLPWGLVFPRRPKHRFHDVPVHPTQIYDGLLALSWLAILLALDRRRALRPYLFPAFVLLYTVSRFATETLRPEFRRGFSKSQLFEAAAGTAVALMLIFARRLWLRFLNPPAEPRLDAAGPSRTA